MQARIEIRAFHVRKRGRENDARGVMISELFAGQAAEVWQFGKLHDRVFTREFRSFVLSDLPALFAAWNYVFIQAKEQALAPAA